jgi:hypothetical protein
LKSNLEIESGDFGEVVRHIWARKRAITTLKAEQDEMNKTLVQKVMKIILEAGK